MTKSLTYNKECNNFIRYKNVATTKRKAKNNCNYQN